MWVAQDKHRAVALLELGAPASLAGLALKNRCSLASLALEAVAWAKLLVFFLLFYILDLPCLCPLKPQCGNPSDAPVMLQLLRSQARPHHLPGPEVTSVILHIPRAR